MTMLLPELRSQMLNINQPPTELEQLYGEKDYYWYLRSAPFREMFLTPLGLCIAALPGVESVLDVGCGEGQLGDHINPPIRYTGFDGSVSAIARGLSYSPGKDLRLGRMEHPEVTVQSHYDVVVLGGLLSVLVKPEHHMDFVEMYLHFFTPSYLAIYDLQRLDTYTLDTTFPAAHRYASEVTLEGIEPVKRLRKFIIYKV